MANWEGRKENKGSFGFLQLPVVVASKGNGNAENAGDFCYEKESRL